MPASRSATSNISAHHEVGPGDDMLRALLSVGSGCSAAMDSFSTLFLLLVHLLPSHMLIMSIVRTTGFACSGTTYHLLRLWRSRALTAGIDHRSRQTRRIYKLDKSRWGHSYIHTWLFSKFFALAFMAPPQDDRGDTLPSFTLWHKLQQAPLLLALRESQTHYLRIVRPM